MAELSEMDVMDFMYEMEAGNLSCKFVKNELKRGSGDARTVTDIGAEIGYDKAAEYARNHKSGNSTPKKTRSQRTRERLRVARNPAGVKRPSKSPPRYT